MDVPQPVLDAIASAVRRGKTGLFAPDALQLDLSVDTSFHSDGLSGANLERVCVGARDNGRETSAAFFAKHWDSCGWLTQLMGLDVPLESLLYENGHIRHVNSIEGLRAPIIGSVRTEDDAWTIMEDVSEQLSAWRTSTIDPNGPSWRQSSDALPLQRALLDRMAALHVKSEDPEYLQTARKHLMSQERRLRWFERLFRDLLTGSYPDPQDTPAIRDANEHFANARWERYLAFLDGLPAKDRSTWAKHMQCRDSLVEAASGLPVTFLHGDLNWRNIGVRRANSVTAYVLIDWEIACLGNPALDVYYFLSGPVLSGSDRDGLAEHYYERYLSHGGRQLDRRQWERACDVAIAHYGVCWLPHKSEWVKQAGDDTANGHIEEIVERTNRALHNITL